LGQSHRWQHLHHVHLRHKIFKSRRKITLKRNFQILSKKVKLIKLKWNKTNKHVKFNDRKKYNNQSISITSFKVVQNFRFKHLWSYWFKGEVMSRISLLWVWPVTLLLRLHRIPSDPLVRYIKLHLWSLII
jgi:hypothetical protein